MHIKEELIALDPIKFPMLKKAGGYYDLEVIPYKDLSPKIKLLMNNIRVQFAELVKNSKNTYRIPIIKDE